MNKKILAFCSSVALAASAAFAQVTITATPITQGPLTDGQTFNVTFTLNVTGNSPSTISSADLIFEGVATQNGSSLGNFSVTGYTPPSSRPDWAAIAFHPDVFGSITTDRTGYLQTSDEGPSGNGTMTALTSNFSLGTWTLTIGNVNPGTYNFDTTVQATSSSHFSDMFSGDTLTPFANSAPFSITVVPEPATWLLLGFGSTAILGLSIFRTRRS